MTFEKKNLERRKPSCPVTFGYDKNMTQESLLHANNKYADQPLRPYCLIST